MTFPTVLELERAQGEAARQVLTRSPEALTVKEAILLLGSAIKMGQRAKAIADLPYDLLTEGGGMEASQLVELCGPAGRVIDIYLDVLERVRYLTRETARLHNAVVPALNELEACHAALLQSRARNESLLAKATPKRKTDEDWQRIWEGARRGQEEISRGDFISHPPSTQE